MLFFHFLNEPQPPCRSNSVGIISMPPGPMLSTHTLHRQVARCLRGSRQTGAIHRRFEQLHTAAGSQLLGIRAGMGMAGWQQQSHTQTTGLH
jgi:hypothetical protein